MSCLLIAALLAAGFAARAEPEDLPPGVLKAGGNMVRFAANQRHRTDCTVESTFELWTDIDPKRTFRPTLQ